MIRSPHLAGEPSVQLDSKSSSASNCFGHNKPRHHIQRTYYRPHHSIYGTPPCQDSRDCPFGHGARASPCARSASVNKWAGYQPIRSPTPARPKNLGEIPNRPQQAVMSASVKPGSKAVSVTGVPAGAEQKSTRDASCGWCHDPRGRRRCPWVSIVAHCGAQANAQEAVRIAANPLAAVLLTL